MQERHTGHIGFGNRKRDWGLYPTQYRAVVSECGYGHARLTELQRYCEHYAGPWKLRKHYGKRREHPYAPTGNLRH